MNTVYQVQPLILGDVATFPLASRKSKVSVADFARPVSGSAATAKFRDTLPRILAADDLRGVLSAIQQARRRRRTLVLGTRGHVIQTVLGPNIIHLSTRGYSSRIMISSPAQSAPSGPPV